MNDNGNNQLKKSMNETDGYRRIANTNNIYVAPHYQIDIVIEGLNAPSSMVFTENGDLYIAESGISTGKARILRLRQESFQVISDHFDVPVTGINYKEGRLYISQKGSITEIDLEGSRNDIIVGLPCNGDYSVSNVVFGNDEKIYFGLGTATNSGVVGEDNQWVYDHPLLHDEPAIDTVFVGQNFITRNVYLNQENSKKEKALTGAFSSFGELNRENEIKKGIVKASGSILKMNKDGTELELVAWGLRNPISIRFDNMDRLFVANRGMDVRGSRPIANAPDEFLNIISGVWYGWPDYAAGEAVTSPRFTPEGGEAAELLIANPPNIPQKPFADFHPHSSIAGFDFNYTKNFGLYGDAFIAEFGSYGPITVGPSKPYEGIGHKISQIDMITGAVSTFMFNKTGMSAAMNEEGGFGRLVDVVFGPDSAMYILDMGIARKDNLKLVYPHTGMIWKVRNSKVAVNDSIR